MKLSNNYKIVLFYGHVLRVGSRAAYISADSDGDIYTYVSKPTIRGNAVVWQGSSDARIGPTVMFEQGESWKDTLTYCEGEGQEWMLDLKTKIVVEYALLQDGSILQQKALCNVMEALPFGEPFTQPQWEAFRKHSGVANVVGKEFLDALEEKIKQATTQYIEVEKREGFEDDSRLVRGYYGAELVIPDWTQFIAMDRDGMVWCYEERPDAVTTNNGASGVWTTGGRGKACNVGWRSEKTGETNWRDSLRAVQQ